jgi:pimeloyl-ACP methyl ester carboxylesterase
MTQSVALSGGPTLVIREWGRPDGAVILLLHDLGSSGDSWRHVAPLLGQRFRVVAVDLRGHGGSSHTTDYSFEAMRNDVIRLLDALGFLGVIAIGHSMGGLVAYLLAATRPDLVRALVLEEVPPPDPANPPHEVPRRSRPDDPCDWRAISQVLRWRNDPPQEWWGLARRIACPALIVSATQSHLSQSRLAELARRMPLGEFVTVEGEHDLHELRPGEFDAAVEPFLTPWALAVQH